MYPTALKFSLSLTVALVLAASVSLHGPTESTASRLTQLHAFQTNQALQAMTLETVRLSGTLAGLRRSTDRESQRRMAAASRTALVVEIAPTVWDRLEDELRGIASPGFLGNLGRAIPHRTSGGGINGVRLSGIRRSTSFERLGFRNGDIFQSLNGRQIKSQSIVQDLRLAFRGESVIIEVVRREKRARWVLLRSEAAEVDSGRCGTSQLGGN